MVNQHEWLYLLVIQRAFWNFTIRRNLKDFMQYLDLVLFCSTSSKASESKFKKVIIIMQAHALLFCVGWWVRGGEWGRGFGHESHESSSISLLQLKGISIQLQFELISKPLPNVNLKDLTLL